MLGGDGYCGWPTALHLSDRGHDVVAVDSLIKRRWEAEIGVQSLTPIASLEERVGAWAATSGKVIELEIGDLLDWDFLSSVFERHMPDAVVHFAEQPSAPFSMLDREHALLTQHNNVLGTLNVLFALRDYVPNCHLVKLGTMGEYGTPNIAIEEGFIEIKHKGRTDVLPFPKQAGSSITSLRCTTRTTSTSRVVCGVSGATDLNQGVVYGTVSPQTSHDPALSNRLYYDHIFGTALNRFCVQAAIGHPITVYGEGGQTRGFLDIRDTVRCIELAVDNPPADGEYRVFNQFTERFSVAELADLVVEAAAHLGIAATVDHLPNPRVEAENHYYEPTHTRLLDLGLEPHRLSDVAARLADQHRSRAP